MLYSKGDTVVCKGSGVCEIIDIKKERFADKAQNYYILSPLYEVCPTKIFIPVVNEKTRLRPLITKEEIIKSIKAVKDEERLWVDDEKARERVFSEILKSGEFTKIIKLVGEIYEKQKEKKQKGGKIRQSDERILKDSEKIISFEFAFVLDISPKEVKNFILKELQ